jgi:hypothetical protein
MIALLLGERPAGVRPAFVSDPTGCVTAALVAGFRQAYQDAELTLFPDPPARIHAATIPPERRAGGYRDLWQALPRGDRRSVLLAVGGGVHGLAGSAGDDAVAAVVVADPIRFEAIPSQWDVALAPWGGDHDDLLLRGDDVAAVGRAIAEATGASEPKRLGKVAARAGRMPSTPVEELVPRDLELYERAT